MKPLEQILCINDYSMLVIYLGQSIWHIGSDSHLSSKEKNKVLIT
jgi:hypothetical protein